MNNILKAALAVIFALLIIGPGVGEAVELEGWGTDQKPYRIPPSHGDPRLSWDNTNLLLETRAIHGEIRRPNNELVTEFGVLNDNDFFGPADITHDINIAPYLNPLPIGPYYLHIKVENPDGQESPWSDKVYFELIEEPVTPPSRPSGCRIF